MTGKFSIRKAAGGDAGAILQCLREAFEAHRARYTPEAFRDTVLTPETLRHRLENMTVFVAAGEDGEIVGTVACQVVHPEQGHVRGMAVRPPWQGAGVAGQLLHAVESELRLLSCSRISLDTTQPLEQAIRFYERHGFQRSGKIADFFGMPLVEYVKPLP